MGVLQKATVLEYSLFQTWIIHSLYKFMIYFSVVQQWKQGHSSDPESREETELLKALGDGSCCKGILKSLSIQPYGPQGSLPPLISSYWLMSGPGFTALLICFLVLDVGWGLCYDGCGMGITFWRDPFHQPLFIFMQSCPANKTQRKIE